MAERQCVATGSNTVLLVNSLVNATALFTFLSLFYMLYGSKIETKASNEKFAGLISKNLKTALDDANEETGGRLKDGMMALDPVWDVLQRQYRGPDPTTVTYNTWLFRMSSAVALFMFVALSGTLLVLKFSCGQCPTGFLWKMLGENAVIFAAIGGVEYLFFKNVALKMVPAPPSLMVDEVIKKIKDGIF